MRLLVQRPGDVINRKKMSAVWFPYTAIRQLWCDLEEMQNTGHSVEQCNQLRNLLGQSLAIHLKQVLSCQRRKHTLSLYNYEFLHLQICKYITCVILVFTDKVGFRRCIVYYTRARNIKHNRADCILISLNRSITHTFAYDIV
jgi:hypothetical protein